MMKKIYGLCRKCWGIIIITQSRSTDLDNVFCPNCGCMTSVDTTYSEKTKERVAEIRGTIENQIDGYDLTDEEKAELKENLRNTKESVSFRYEKGKVLDTNIINDKLIETIHYKNNQLIHSIQLLVKTDNFWDDYPLIQEDVIC